MSNVPANPKIYHITHLRNLPQIIDAGKLWSDAKRIELGLQSDVVGMSHIKQRRLKEIGVDCHPGTHVGEYVPFYLCPRSIMLYILHRGNHPDVKYTEGQQPIIHLEADLRAVVKWADDNKRRWAFSDRNAGTRYAVFFNAIESLQSLNWEAIESNQWSNPAIREAKQAEFLVHTSFPWQLVERVAVCNRRILKQVQQAIEGATHRPVAAVKPGWYY
jgi:hypothetical protein